MSAITFSNKVFDREVAFCKVYSLESKEKLEKLFLKNISIVSPSSPKQLCHSEYIFSLYFGEESRISISYPL